MLYIALLRGINVGGHRVQMDRLRQLFAELGLANVRSYIVSGNVFFETDETDREALTRRIEEHLGQALGYQVPVFLRTVPEVEQIMALDPFKKLTVTEDMRLCVTFTDTAIPASLALPLRSPRNDMEIIAVLDRDAFIVWHIINGRPPAAYDFKELGKRTTTRFYHTLGKILDAAKKG